MSRETDLVPDLLGSVWSIRSKPAVKQEKPKILNGEGIPPAALRAALPNTEYLSLSQWVNTRNLSFSAAEVVAERHSETRTPADSAGIAVSRVGKGTSIA
jgi:hypothetical protein